MKTFKAACVQTKAYGFEDKEIALETALTLVDQAASEKPDIVVLPECIYPAYFLKQNNIDSISESDLQIALMGFKNKAKQHSLYIAVGMVEKKNNKLFNSTYLLDYSGKVIAVAKKQFLWHVDNLWFHSGNDFCLADTDLGKIGILICADARQPEIARVLSIKGAQVLIDTVNLVSSGFDPQHLTNQQCEFMLSTRAIENNVWLLVANKVGIESNSFVYCGRSCIINTEGEKVAEASTHIEEIVYGEINLQAKGLTSKIGLNPIKNAITPPLYEVLIKPNDSLPLSNVLSNKPVTSGTNHVYVSVVQLDNSNSFQDCTTKIQYYADILSQQGSELIVFPEMSALNNLDSFYGIDSLFVNLSKQYGLRIVGASAKNNNGFINKITRIYKNGDIEKEYTQIHLSLLEEEIYNKKDSEPPVLNTSSGIIGLMKGADGFYPEMARALMLLGSDILIWQINYNLTQIIPIARTRAAENKVWVLVANTSSSGNSMIVSPAGQVVAGAFKGTEQAISFGVEPILSRNKELAPHTNVFTSRQPKYYNYLHNSHANKYKPRSSD